MTTQEIVAALKAGARVKATNVRAREKTEYWLDMGESMHQLSPFMFAKLDPFVDPIAGQPALDGSITQVWRA